MNKRDTIFQESLGDEKIDVDESFSFSERRSFNSNNISKNLEVIFPSLKIVYFGDGKGRNELIRLILAVADIAFEDELIPSSTYKSMRHQQKSLPFGQLPVLFVGRGENQQVFGQSCAIARYCAKLGGLYPQDPIQAMFTDGIVDSWRDMLDRFYSTVFRYEVVDGVLQMVAFPQKSRHNLLTEFVQYDLVPMLKRYESLLQPEGQLLVELYPCWADIAIFDLVKTMERSLSSKVFSSMISGFPKLQASVERMENTRTVRDHYLKYPDKNISVLWEKQSVSGYDILLTRSNIVTVYVLLFVALLMSMLACVFQLPLVRSFFSA